MQPGGVASQSKNNLNPLAARCDSERITPQLLEKTQDNQPRYALHRKMTTSNEDLIARLRQWDSKTVRDVVAIYQEFRLQAGFLDSLIGACARPETETAATWLIKHHVEDGQVEVSHAQAELYYQNAVSLTQWQAQLHALQTMDHVALSEQMSTEVYDFVSAAISSDKTLLRAWGYYGLALVALQEPAKKVHAMKTLRRAAQTHSKGAIAVRVRKALERLAISPDSNELRK